MMWISSGLNLYETTLDRNKIWYFLDSASNCLQINCDQHIHSLSLSKQRNSNKCISFSQVKFSSSISMARHSKGSTNQSCKRLSLKGNTFTYVLCFLWTNPNIWVRSVEPKDCRSLVTAYHWLFKWLQNNENYLKSNYWMKFTLRDVFTGLCFYCTLKAPLNWKSKKFEYDERQNKGSVNIFPPKKKMKIFKSPMESEFTEVPNLPPLKFSFVLPDGYPTVSSKTLQHEFPGANII